MECQLKCNFCVLLDYFSTVNYVDFSSVNYIVKYAYYNGVIYRKYIITGNSNNIKKCADKQIINKYISYR